MKWATYIAIAFIGIGAILFNKAIWDWYIDQRIEKAENPELCEVGRVNEDGSIDITENQPGNYEYTIYATTEGAKVLADCK